MDAGDYGLTGGAFLVARRFEAIVVAGLLWIWCVLGAAGFCFFVFFSFERTRHAASMRPSCLLYISTSNDARPRERGD